MPIIDALQMLAVLATAATGLICIVAPRRVIGFTGLQPIGGRGLTELRAVSMVVDHSVVQSNVISLLTELVLGVILIM